MSVYINGTGLIAPNWDCENRNFNENFQVTDVPFLSVNEPDYKKYINPVTIRRMSKVLKMGSTTAKLAIEQAEVDSVDAIILGTGYGCFSDTEVFLDGIIDNSEKQLTPTAFIQSTHNSVNSQIAMILKCNGYNYTYSHRYLSFENALDDSIMLLNNNEAESVLCGGFDEITDLLYNALISSDSKKSRFLYGESCGMFYLSNKKSNNNICKIDTVLTQSRSENVILLIEDLLSNNNFGFDDIDLILGNYNLEELNLNLPGHKFLGWKHLTGESMTSSVASLALATQIIKSQQVPQQIKFHKTEYSEINSILIINSYLNHFGSLILVSKC